MKNLINTNLKKSKHIYKKNEFEGYNLQKKSQQMKEQKIGVVGLKRCTRKSLSIYILIFPSRC